MIFPVVYYLEGKLTCQLQYNISSLSCVVYLPDLVIGHGIKAGNIAR